MAGTAPTILAPIYPIQSMNNDQPQQRRLLEVSGEDCVRGAVIVVTAGYAVESGAISADTTQIAGFAAEAGHSQTSSGVAGPGLTYGSVPNQTAADIIAVGSPPEDGRLGVYLACDGTLFCGYTDSAHTLAVTDVGSQAGLTKDGTTGIWFVDFTITDTNGQIVEIVELLDAVGTVGGRVIFKVNKANQQLSI